MTEEARSRAMPMRRWLALALVTVFLLPVCVTVGFAIAWVHQEPFEPRAHAVSVLTEEADRWDDAAWRQRTARELAQDDVAFVLLEGGQEFFRSTQAPIAGAGDDGPRVVEKVTIPDTRPPKVAYVYADERTGPPEEVPVRLLPFVGLTTLALTLTGIAWFLGRTTLRPLAATSEAAHEIARGNLDVTLPSSRVREVDEVNEAFNRMSAGLRASLHHQTEMEEERRLFIGAIAHDLRTPLFSLRGYLEGLQQGVTDTGEKRRRYLAIAQEKADELEHLIAELFDFTRLEYLEQTPDYERFDLCDLVGRLVEGAQPQADRKHITLPVDLPGQDCTVDGDERLLTRVVENLLDNALRHTPEGERIDVSCRVGSGSLVFSVADTGAGIPEQDLPHLFTPLFRGETSRNRRTGGAGLGLTIARRIMQAHGGDLTAANRPDGGAVFTATLPKRR